jgi:hypothetical protein
MLAFALVLAAGCQDYNFNPVGHCLIQPGTRRVTLSNVSTADVLFVVDESGSMAGEQAALATNFDSFIDNLNQANVDRAAGGLQPLDFHLAVTTSSVYWNYQTTETCRTDCPGAAGQPVCCTSGNLPAREPITCAGPGAACPAGSGTTCRLDCNRLQGEYHCCAPDGSFPSEVMTELVPCTRPGVMCGTLETHYLPGCTSSVAASEWPYPGGDFVSRGDFVGYATPPNPRVLHFDKELYAGGTGLNKQGYTSTQLITWFKENVQVGTCGSGQEQALQAGRLAVEKALAGQQKDTRNAAGAVAWTAPTTTELPGSAPASWPNPNSKLVVVFVGDEDDCSGPQDPSGGVVMLAESPTCGTPGACDACQRDALSTTPAEIRNKEFPVSDFVSYLTGLGRPVAAAFILPAAQETCSIDTCTTAGLCCPPTGCTQTDGAQARGPRLLAAAQGLAEAGVEVVAGSICDPAFGTILDQIAEIVKPPAGLELPTQPAAEEVTLLRIADSGGQTRKVCSRPAPAGLSLAEAQDAVDGQGNRYDWWFTADGNPGGSVAPSKFVYINPKGSCIANPGETYSADYLGQVPADGCRDDDHCRQVLGGSAGSWTCYAGVNGAGVCDASVDLDPGSAERWSGTCICGARSQNCPNG